MKITFDNSAISENLTNFPMPVVFDGGETEFWNCVSSDGSDIRFVDSDDSTELYFELEQWDYSGNNMVAWVKVPQVNGGSTTDHIFVYYKNDMAVSFDGYYNSTQVWDLNYVAVWHLNQTSGTIYDATGNNNHGTVTNVKGTANCNASGKLQGCWEFHGTAKGEQQYIEVSDSDSLHLVTTFVLEAWVNTNSDSDNHKAVLSKSNQAGKLNYNMYVKNQKTTPLEWGGTGTTEVSGTTTITKDSWSYITGVFNSTNKYAYTNGGYEASAGRNTGATYNNGTLRIGADWWPSDGSDGQTFNGRIDEVRISNISRSDEWIEACYQYQVDQSKIQLERWPKPTLTMSPDSVTCRKFCENFTITINVSKVVNVEDFKFGIYYNTTLLDYLNVTWNAWGSGTIYNNSTRGILVGDTSGSPATGNLTLATITFHAAYYHIWHSGDCENWTNNLAGTIYFQWASLGYPDVPDRHYEKDGPTEINVDPEEVAYIFSPIKGDVDNDGFVRIIDVRAVAAYYDVTYLDAEWAEASAYDLNCDQIVDLLDLVTVCGNYGYKYDS